MGTYSDGYAAGSNRLLRWFELKLAELRAGKPPEGYVELVILIPESPGNPVRLQWPEKISPESVLMVEQCVSAYCKRWATHQPNEQEQR